MDKDYEELIKAIQRLSKQKPNLLIGTMTGSRSCKVNDLTLGSGDLLCSHHLVTGWLKDSETFISPLHKGEMVLLYKVNDEKYAIVERLVEL